MMDQPSSSFSDSGFGSQEYQYKIKLKQLKDVVSNYVFLNAALCDQVTDTQDRLIIAKEKRRFLTEKLYQIRAQLEQDNQLQSNKPVQQIVVSPQQLFTSTFEEENTRRVHQPQFVSDDESLTPKKKIKLKKTPSAAASSSASVAGPSKAKKTVESTPQRAQQSLLTSSVSQPYARSDVYVTNDQSLRCATAAGRSGVKSIQVDAHGMPVFPLTIGELTIYSLGSFDCNEEYNTLSMAPVGYCSSRVYVSMTDMYSKCIYTCRVLDGGDAPSFEIDYEDYENVKIPLIGRSANECLSKLMHYVNKAIGFQIVNTRNLGEKFFGLSHPGVKDLIRIVLLSKKQPDPRHGIMISIGPDEKLDDTLNFDALQNRIAYYNFDFENMDVAEEVLDSF